MIGNQLRMRGGKRFLATCTARPIFLDKFAAFELQKSTIFSVLRTDHQPSALPSLKVIGPHSKRAAQVLLSLDVSGNIGKAIVAPISIGGISGFGVYFPSQNSLEFYTKDTEKLSATFNRLGSDFKNVSTDELLKRLFGSSLMKINDFSEISELFYAKSEEERRQKLRESGVGLSSLYQSWKDEFFYCRQLLNAETPVPNVKSQVLDVVKDRLATLSQAMAQHVQDERRPSTIHRGCQMTIFGPPNSGKSSFFNLLTRRNIAKIDQKAGSTANVIDQRLCINGIPLLLTDTVGISNSTKTVSEVAADGLKSTFSRIDSGDLKICVLDMKDVYETKTSVSIPKEILDSIDSDTIVLINKRDLVNIRIPAPAAKIRFKQSPLSPQGDVQRHAMRGRIPLRVDGDTTGNHVLHGDYGLRVLEDVRLTEGCLQECRSMLHRNIKKVRGGRFWLRVLPTHPCVAKAVGTRMGKGKAPFSHWEAKVPNRMIVFEIGGGVNEDLARIIFRGVGSRVPGKTEFVVAPKEENIDEMRARIKEYSSVAPIGIWAISCKTGEGVDNFLSDLSDILKKKYSASICKFIRDAYVRYGLDSLEDVPQSPLTTKMKILGESLETLKHALQSDTFSEITGDIESQLDSIVDKQAVNEAMKFMYHSKVGILKHKMEQLNGGGIGLS